MNVVLVHGGLHGAWCWDGVRPYLVARGLSISAPDLPGMGQNKTPLSQVTLASSADFLTEMIASEGGKVVLLGHSMAGPVISECAERDPSHVKGLIYLAANLVPNGLSMRDAAAGDLNNVMRGVVLSPDGISSTYEPDVAREVFYNTTDPADADWAIARLTPQPIAPTVERLSLSDNRFGKVPRAYIECLQDRAIPIGFQRSMQSKLPCDLVFTMDTDHSPFLCAPRQLADYIWQIVERFSQRDEATATSKD